MDASLAEINPFILTKDGKVYALDAKINFDDNALFRHKDLLELRDLNEEDPLEVEASKFGLNYIKLDGTVGCMVNGAGLAMAHHGHHQVRGRQSGELPGCRRRRERGAGEERVPHSAFRPEREGGADQYFRRHSALRHAGHRRGGGRARSGHHRCRSWCAWKARTWNWAARFSTESGFNFTVADGHAGRGRKSRGAGGAGGKR